MDGIQAMRAEYRHQLALEIVTQPANLALGPLAGIQKANVFSLERRLQRLVESPVLLADQGMGFFADTGQRRSRSHAVRAWLGRGVKDALTKRGDPNLEELIQQQTGNAYETKAFQQGNVGLERLRQHAPVEAQQAQFPVQVQAVIPQVLRRVLRKVLQELVTNR